MQPGPWKTVEQHRASLALVQNMTITLRMITTFARLACKHARQQQKH